MSNRLVLGCALALISAAGCGGGDTMGADSGGGGGSDSGTDAGQDAFVPAPDTGTPNDAATVTDDAGLSDGCDLGNTFPPLALSLVGVMPSLPVGIVLAPGRDDLFVVLRRGQIVIVNPSTGAVGATFLDVTSRLTPTGTGGPTGMAEWGLLGLAFHPDYATNGLFYIAYTAQTSGSTTDCSGRTVTLYEDRVAVGNRDAANADQGAFGSDIFTVQDPASNHNGGQLGFGPDGMLYYGVGDGGEQGDPCHRAPDTTLALGKIHRFHVGPGITGYEAPSDNPFVGGGGLDTIWAYGLRNPWRFSWDRRTQDMYVADVGQDDWEEVDFLPAGTAPGTNFGWSICEGTHDYNGTCSSLTGDVLPIAEYSHTDPVMGGGGNASITGGYVYRGTAIPGLRGGYMYADEVASEFAVLRNCPAAAVTPVHFNFTAGSCISPTTFGEDRAGELLVACYGDRSIYRVVPGT
jgi:glucose/arabinose dehydrogenase